MLMTKMTTEDGHSRLAAPEQIHQPSQAVVGLFVVVHCLWGTALLRQGDRMAQTTLTDYQVSEVDRRWDREWLNPHDLESGLVLM